ncbi:hypothetical protein OGAPHI_004250 [Ogataea philodendri]|uniref:Uncharacterized protein n=1 Tax=Ogataea philodendri TaxID=1378263 RepID=A0A9P8T4T0_9ASCO|nr:uncharacterized protein OGAPHI_004250 [Ogataea philodendri]KAH3666061.1 hypothetical protein OGAPHI_004250 [Ogataea philodendri]
MRSTRKSLLKFCVRRGIWNINVKVPAGRTAGCSVGGHISSVASRVRGGVQHILEVVEVVQGGDRVAVDLHQSVIISFLRVLVNKSTRENRRHLSRVDRSNLRKLSVSRLGERRVSTPRIVIDTKHVDSRSRVITTVEVVSKIESDRGNISSRVTNRDASVVPGLDVLFQVSHGCLDVWSGVQDGLIVDDFVTSEETKNVVVVGKRINRCKDALQEIGVVRAVWVASGNRSSWCGDIKN